MNGNNVKLQVEVKEYGQEFNGVVPVAIFGPATFDVKQIDPTTIKLANPA
ncbi:MAG: hypothetical protein HY813_01765 [Candidatus Portnoybacteria bacterium]|nr:hypothetical protein [Candidatus Portnoybacteria bacterium]